MYKASLYLMCFLYLAAGVNHFINPQFYIAIVPKWLPWPQAIVYISGICEILFALLLLLPATRVLGAWCIIALLLAVFPANLQMTLDYFEKDHPNKWLSVLRLPLQLLLIAWAWLYTRPQKK